jgi:hypothetical protein
MALSYRMQHLKKAPPRNEKTIQKKYLAYGLSLLEIDKDPQNENRYRSNG